MDWTGILAQVSSGLGSTSTALDIVGKARKLLNGPEKAGGNEQRLQLELMMDELSERLVAARATIEALGDANDQLQKENSRLKDFQVDRENYTLLAISAHSFAYVRKDTVPGAKDAVCLCAACFEQSKRSILQFERHEAYTDVLKCHACGSTAHKAADRGPAVRYGPVKRRTIFDV